MLFSTQVRRRMFQLALIAAMAGATPSFAQDQSGLNKGRKINATPTSVKNTSPSNPATNAIAPLNDNAPPVVAVVNGVSISIAELAEQCRVRFGTDVLEDLINKTTIHQACLAQRIEITSADIQKEIDRTAARFELSTKAYLKLIEDRREFTPEQYAADVVWPMLALRALAKDSIAVSPQEIDREFQGEFGPKVKVRMIACADKNKIAQLHREATAKPESFKLLAKEHSEDPASASVEGLLPPIRRFTGDDELESIAFNLKPNEVSRVFAAGGMNIILQCVQHIEPASPPAPQMQEIQARIKAGLEDKKLRESAETVYTTLREKSSVNVVYGNQDLMRQYPNVAAIVNGQSIPMDEFDKLCVKRYGKKILGGEINRKLIEGALNAARIQITQPDIDAEIRNAAEYFGIVKSDGTADVERWMQSIVQEEEMSPELYVRDVIWPTVALKKLTAGQVKVTEEDITKGYESNYGPRAEVLAIVMSNQRTAQQVWELARNNPTEQFFGELATQYSIEDSSRSNFGKVPPLRKHSGQPTLEKAAFDLKPGTQSGIIEVNGRYVILRLQGFTNPVVSGLSDAIRAELNKEIQEKKHRLAMDDYLTKLRESAEIADFLDLKKSRVSKKDTDEALRMLDESKK